MAGLFGESSTERMLKQFMEMYGGVLSGKTPPTSLPEFKYGAAGIDTSINKALEEAFRTAGAKGLTGGGVNKMMEDITGKGFEAKGKLAGDVTGDLWNRISTTGQGIASNDLQAAMAGLQAHTQKHIAAGQEQSGFGKSCCFIFIEGDMLTPSVRKIRDQLFPPDCYIANGYRKMAGWLVPLMKRSKLVKSLVKYIMLIPIAKFCHKKNSLLIPICVVWCIVWEMYGRV